MSLDRFLRDRAAFNSIEGIQLEGRTIQAHVSQT
jgi:hypothetical protein